MATSIATSEDKAPIEDSTHRAPLFVIVALDLSTLRFKASPQCSDSGLLDGVVQLGLIFFPSPNSIMVLSM